MFLEYIATLGFLTPSLDTGILLSFPQATRGVIAAQITDYLLKESTPLNTISTAAHLTLITECVGQGLGLTVIDSKNGAILKSITELYRRWLLEQSRPPAVEQDEQGTFKRIVSHFSLLFLPRNEKESPIDLQVELCSTVLDIILSAIRQAGNRLTTDTWEHLLKVLLGITDSLLRQSRSGGSIEEAVTTSGPGLGNKLCPLLIKVLFEVWLRSNTKNQTLWDSLKELIQGWRYRRPVLEHWSNVVIGLTNRLIRILYGPEEGADITVIHSNVTSTNDKVPLPDDFVAYAWHRVLHLIGDFETLTAANNYLVAVQGIKNVMNAFLQIGTKPRPHYYQGPQPPDGNTILHIVGYWLFRAVNYRKRDFTFDRGVAEALQALCALFAAKHKTDFVSVYLAQFYRGLEEALVRNTFLMEVVISNCDNFFPLELKGSRTLIPSFLNGIAFVFSFGKGRKALSGTMLPFSQLRASCIKILGYIVGLPNIFADTKFADPPKLMKEGPKLAVSTYQEVHLVLEEQILLEGLRTEENPRNLQSLLWTVLIYIYENITVDSNFPNVFVNMLLAQIAAADAWAPEVVLTSLQVVSELAKLYPTFKKEKGKEAATSVVKTLCSVISQECSTAQTRNSFPEDLIVSCFYTVLEWVMIDQSLVKDPEMLKLVYTHADIGLGFTKSITTRDGIALDFVAPTPKVQEAAEYVHICLLNLLDAFPRNFTHLSSISCLQTEEDLIATHQLKPGDISWYSLDKSVIFGVIRHHAKEGEAPFVTIVARDASGRYVWTSQLQIKEYIKAEERPYDGRSANVFDSPLLNNQPASSKLDEDTERFFFYIRGLLEPAEKRRHDSIIEKAHDREQKEKQFLKSYNYRLNYDIQSKIPGLPPNDGSATSGISSRLWLSNFGFNSLSNRSRFFALHNMDNLQPTELMQKLKVVDQTREREIHTVGILYVSKGQIKEDDIFDNAGSSDFRDFVNSVGWQVKIDEHVGYKGGLDSQMTGETAPYYATYDYEVIFYVPSLMSSTLHKRRLVSGNKVLITWVEDFDVASSGAKFIKLDHMINIVISPLRSGLYRIKIVKNKNWVHTTGPLIDEMCVSKHVLASVVLRTAVNCSKLLKEDKTKPFLLRKQLIEELVSSHKNSTPIKEYYSAQYLVNQ